MSRLKEPHYFSQFKPTFMPVVSNERAYLRLFARARAGQLRGEASPNYLADAMVPAAIARVRPDARIVAILRDPVTRAYSDYWHKVRYGRERRPFLEAIRNQLADPSVRTPAPTYVGAGLYVVPIERYLARFSERVLVLFLDDLTADPRAELRRVMAFLGVDADVAGRVRLAVRNATSLPRNGLIRALYRSRGIRSAAQRVIPISLHPALERVVLRRITLPPMEPEARRLLEEFYAPEAPALEGLLGRAVPWATDRRAEVRPPTTEAARSATTPSA
jgi:hypothetical protein